MFFRKKKYCFERKRVEIANETFELVKVLLKKFYKLDLLEVYFFHTLFFHHCNLSVPSKFNYEFKRATEF